MNCVYYNPELDRYWVIDARIYEPDEDGKKKYEHLQDMMLKAISEVLTKIFPQRSKVT